MYLDWTRILYCDLQVPTPASWCHSSQGIYGYVQNKFWDVGLFKYWQVKNIGFFLMALPTVLIALRGVLLDFARDFARVYVVKKNPSAILNKIIVDKRTPYVAYLCICLLVTICIANVQIVTRLVSSSPAYYCAAAHVFSNNNSFIDKLLLFVHVAYFFLGPVLFCNVLPWT